MWHLFLQNKTSGLEAFNASVAAPASGAWGVADVAGAGHYGRWTGNLARDVRRAFLKDVDKPNVCWARIPCKDLATGAAKTLTWCPFLMVHEVLASLVEKSAGDVSSFAAIPQQLLRVKCYFLCQAWHQGRLDAWLGSPRRWRRTPGAQDCGVFLLERAGLLQRRTLLVRFGGEGRVVSFGTVAVPTLSSTDATLTNTKATLAPTEARVEKVSGTHTTETGILLRVRCHSAHFLLEHEVPSCTVVTIGAARPGTVTEYRQSAGCSWSQELLLQVRGDWAWYKALFGFKGWASKEICWRCKARDQCRPSVLFAWFFGRAHLHRCVALDEPGHDAGRDWNCVFRSGRRPGWDTSCCQFPVYVSAFVFVCVFVCAPRACPVVFRLSCRLFDTQSRLRSLTWEMIRVDQKPPKPRAKGAETRHLVPCCFEMVMDFHKHHRSAHSLTVRGLFEQLFGLYMTMSVEPFDSAACARCSRQLCNLYKALSKEASDDKL